MACTQGQFPGSPPNPFHTLLAHKPRAQQFDARTILVGGVVLDGTLQVLYGIERGVC